MKFIFIWSVLVASVAVSLCTFCYRGSERFQFGDVYTPHFDCTMYICLPTGNFSTIKCVPPNPLCQPMPANPRLKFPGCCTTCATEPLNETSTEGTKSPTTTLLATSPKA